MRFNIDVKSSMVVEINYENNLTCLIMNRLLIFLISFFLYFNLNAQSYTPTDEGSKVNFVIKNFGINTAGTFKGLAGSIKFDRNNLSLAEFIVNIEAKTINTDIEARDNHIRKEEYFDVDNYPFITFISTKISKTNTEGWLYVFGKLSIKGTTKSVKFPFKAIETNDGILFEGDFSINRKDFKVGGKSISLADNIKVSLSVFGKRNL